MGYKRNNSIIQLPTKSIFAGITMYIVYQTGIIVQNGFMVIKWNPV